MSMFPPNTGPIRRSHHPGSSYDNRMQTTPQAISQNPNAGIPQHNARNYGSTPRSFPGPGYSPAQSPHQPGQYMNQHVFSSGGGTPELNTSHVTVSSTGKSNGTYMFQPNQRMPFPPPQQTQVHSQNVYTPTTIPKFAAHSNSNASFMANVPQNPGIMTPGYYMPQPQPQVGRTPRFVPPNSVQTGTPMQVTSPHYFPTQPPTFYHQQGPMQPVPQYYDSTTTMPYSGGRVRKAITIRDPDSLKAVTDDILLSGKKSGGTSPSARSTTAPAIPSVDVLPQVRSILKKLAPQRFSELMVEFQKLPINSEQSLTGVIDQIFEKTINKPELCYQCAKMCLTLSQLWNNCRVIVDIPGTSVQSQHQTTIVEFRKVLLTRCQRELEKDRQNENVISKLQQKLEEATTLETKQQCKEDLKVAEDEKRKRLLRNVRFFAELFKLKLLTESIMHTCMMSLLKNGDNESLEFICRLLTTIGKDLDHVKEKSRIDEYFREIENLTREKRTSHCVRLMIPYLLNLRKNGWRKYQAQGR